MNRLRQLMGASDVYLKFYEFVDDKTLFTFTFLNEHVLVFPWEN